MSAARFGTDAEVGLAGSHQFQHFRLRNVVDRDDDARMLLGEDLNQVRQDQRCLQ